MSNSKSSKIHAKKQEPTYFDKTSLKSFISRYGDEEGKRRFAQSHERRKNTCSKKYGEEFYFKTDMWFIKSQRTYLNNYGVNWYSKSEEFNEKRKRNCLAKYGVDSVSQIEDVKIKCKNTKIKNGIIIPDHKKSEWSLYYKDVWSVTRKQNIYVIDDIEKRGNSNSNGYHLDHKISIKHGFENNISPETIGDISNLQMLHYSENSAKRYNSYSVIDQNKHLIKEKYVYRERVSFK